MGLASYTWLTREYILKCFGINDLAISSFEAYVLKGIGIQLEIDFKAGCQEGILGDSEFVQEVLKTIEEKPNRDVQISDLVSVVCQRYSVTISSVCGPGKHQSQSRIRAIPALLVQESSTLRLEDLAKVLERDASGLSRLANRLAQQCTAEESVGRELAEIRSTLFNVD